MNDENIDTHTSKTWLEKLGQALSREPQDREQLINLLRDAEQRQLLDADALAMIEGVLQVSELRARDIMIPRAQMVSIDENHDINEFLPMIISTAHSRFPVISDNDKISGIIHAKDLLRYSMNQYKDFNIRDILRPANFVPESRSLDKLLKDFRLTHNHMAVVIDEYGEIAGIVTIEDILEQIVGEIEDEFDVEDEAYIKKHSDLEYIVKAVTPIDEFNQYFSTTLSHEEYDTIGGIVIQAFGRVPKRGETVSIDKFYFKILNADTRHVRLLQVGVVES